VTVATTDARDGAGRLGGSRVRPRQAAGLDGVEVRVFPNPSDRLAYRRQLFLPLGLAGFLRERAAGFDVAHRHGFHHLLGVRAAGALRLAGVPYVAAPNGLASGTEGQRLAKRLFHLALGRGDLPGAARVLAVSGAERADLAALGVDPARLRVVDNPLDLADLDPPHPPGALRARLGGAVGQVVLYLGTLLPRKGVDVLVRAFARLARPGAVLAVAGNDLGAGPAVRRLVDALGLGARVRFLGQVAGRERAGLLADADAVAYVGRAEASGSSPSRPSPAGRRSSWPATRGAAS